VTWPESTSRHTLSRMPAGTGLGGGHTRLGDQRISHPHGIPRSGPCPRMINSTGRLRLTTERGSREYDSWYKVRGKWVRMTNINRAHTASAAVNAGSIKAIRTTLPADHPDALLSLPDRPSVAWLQMVDKRAAIDQGRTETAESEKRYGVWQQSVENVDNFDPTRPSRSTPPKPTEEPEDGRGE
jgi:hypothetical protein